MKRLYRQNWYRPMEIAKLGLIRSPSIHGNLANTTGSHYQYILRLIKSGRLRAKNNSTGDKPYYLVPESEIARYHNTVIKIDDIVKIRSAKK